jgi:hypothetical protein
MASHPVDMARLTTVYNAHRASFWATVAADYGPGANPLVLEQAWRGTSASSSSSAPHTTSGCSGPHSAAGSSSAGSSALVGIAAQTPITPVGSPDDHIYSAHHSAAGHAHHNLSNNSNNNNSAAKPDKTRISAILGIDANPRSPSEREMVRRLEEEMGGVVGIGVVSA